MIAALVDGLTRDGFGVVPAFFPPALVGALRAEISAESLRPAGIGRAAEVHREVRTDHIRWLDDEGATAAEREALALLHDLRVGLDRQLFLGLRRCECHLALYEPGGHYDKHLDSVRGGSRRKVSFVVYLNDDWRPEEGGALRLYRQGSDDERACDILPVGGTLACFLSEEIWHEVRPTARRRFSLTGWLGN